MKRTALFALLISLFTIVKAQVPQQLNYQGIARDASANPITFQNITVRLSIIDNATGGQTVYQETRRVKTNYVGLFNIIIGSAGATDVTGSIGGVNWSTGQKDLKIEIDPNGSNNFSLAGVTQLQSVPYALSASPAGTASGDLTGTYPAPTIANNAVTINKIANGSINLSKLAPDVTTSITKKLNISDTASMLAPYAGAVDVTASLGTKLNKSDTATMLNPYYRSATALTDLATKEDIVNKSIDVTSDGSSDTKYPSVKSVKDYVDAATTGNSTALNAEVTRATNAEGVLTNNLNTETTDRTNGDAIINANLNSEVTRATNAEGVLTTNLSAETTNRTNADVTIISNLNNEVSRATTAEATKENVANKSTNTILGTSDVLYPTQNAVKTYVDAQIIGNSTPDATTLAKGKIQLAGDLTGTASLPIIADGKITTSKILDASVTDAKIATGISASKVGLSNVNNTSDINKPISTATQTALSLKADLASPTFTGTVSGMTKSMVGLSNVDNTSDVNKPVSTATQTALNLKEDLSNKSTTTALGTSDVLYPTQNAVKFYVDSVITKNGTDYVDLTNNQTIAGTKTFSADLLVNSLTIGHGGANISSNTATGAGTLANNTGGYNNTANGFYTLNNNTTGHGNTGSGFAALSYNTTGSYNTANGVAALQANTTGTYNTAIGYQADAAGNNQTNSTAVGYGAIVNASNKIQLGNTSVTALNTSGKLTTGTVTYPNTDGTNGQALTTNGSGTVSWSSVLVRDVADEFSATASQTSFTLTQSPSINSKVKMYVNGIRISNTAYSISGTTLTYNAVNNGSYALTASDRIQFDYYY